MKKIIKNFIPSSIFEWYVNRKYYKYKKMTSAEVFSDIYKKNLWGSSESKSGTGSELVQTKEIIFQINKLIQSYQIKSILDIPCGDFNWMRYVDLEKVQYIGSDVVDEIIENNNKKYKSPNIEFKVLDLINDKLPKVDLIIVRDCFIHFSLENINTALINLKNSGSKFLLTTSFMDCNENYNIITGSYRKINLLKSPFNFSNPLLIINEKCTEGEGVNKDKSLVLFELKNI
jgi:hypothetical protein